MFRRPHTLNLLILANTRRVATFYANLLNISGMASGSFFPTVFLLFWQHWLPISTIQDTLKLPSGPRDYNVCGRPSAKRSKDVLKDSCPQRGPRRSPEPGIQEKVQKLLQNHISRLDDIHMAHAPDDMIPLPSTSLASTLMFNFPRSDNIDGPEPTRQKQRNPLQGITLSYRPCWRLRVPSNSQTRRNRILRWIQ